MGAAWAPPGQVVGHHSTHSPGASWGPKGGLGPEVELLFSFHFFLLSHLGTGISYLDLVLAYGLG